MLIEVTKTENAVVITVPIDELNKFGLSIGDEIEVFQNKDNEIILRAKRQNERTKKILDATREIIENRRSALIELGKGHE